MFEFKILTKDKATKARVGEFSTPHGKLITPELAFVATEGELKSVPKEILPSLPVNLIIVNTFHLWTKRRINKIYHLDNGRHRDGNSRNKSTAIHDYANFNRPIMSDSGGFQVFSMGFGKSHGVGKITNIFPQLNVDYPERAQRVEGSYYDQGNPLKISEEGVEFTFNSQKLLLTPEKSTELQQQIGADIIFAFDECTSPLNSSGYTKEAMERTHRWLIRCLKQHKKFQIPITKSQTNPKSKIQNYKGLEHLNLNNSNLFGAWNLGFGALFGIIQGGYYEDLRKKSAKFVGKQDVPGFGIGGSLGRNKQDMHHVLEWVIPLLPDEKPRHLLGIGQVRDIFECIERGVDLFDCVIPTREARHQVLYTKRGRVNLKKMKNVDDIIEKNCKCIACQNNVTMKQLSNLFLLKDPHAYFFATVHNIQFYADLMENIRISLGNGKLLSLKEFYLKYY